MPNINNINTPVTVHVHCPGGEIDKKQQIVSKIEDVEKGQDVSIRLEGEIDRLNESIRRTRDTLVDVVESSDTDTQMKSKIEEQENEVVQLQDTLREVIDATTEHDSTFIDISKILGENVTGDMIELAREILSSVDNDVNRFIVTIIDRYGKALENLKSARSNATNVLPVDIDAQSVKDELDSIKRILAMDPDSKGQELIDCEKKVDILLGAIPGGVMPLIYDTTDDGKLGEISNIHLVLDIIRTEESGYMSQDGEFVTVPILSHLNEIFKLAVKGEDTGSVMEKLTHGIRKILKDDTIDLVGILSEHIGKDWMKIEVPSLLNKLEKRSTQVFNSIKGFPTWKRVNSASDILDLILPFTKDIHSMTHGFIPVDFDYIRRGVNETSARHVARYMYEIQKVNPEKSTDEIYKFSKSQIDLIATSSFQKMFYPVLYPGKKSEDTIIEKVRDGIIDREVPVTIDSSFHQKKKDMQDFIKSIPSMVKKGRFDIVFSMLYALKRSSDMVASKISDSWGMDQVVISVTRGTGESGGVTRKLGGLTGESKFNVDLELLQDKDGVMKVSNPYQDVEYTSRYAKFIKENVLGGFIAPSGGISVTSGPVKTEADDLFTYVMGKKPYNTVRVSEPPTIRVPSMIPDSPALAPPAPPALPTRPVPLAPPAPPALPTRPVPLAPPAPPALPRSPPTRPVVRMPTVVPESVMDELARKLANRRID